MDPSRAHPRRATDRLVFLSISYLPPQGWSGSRHVSSRYPMIAVADPSVRRRALSRTDQFTSGTREDLAHRRGIACAPGAARAVSRRRRRRSAAPAGTRSHPAAARGGSDRRDRRRRDGRSPGPGRCRPAWIGGGRSRTRKRPGSHRPTRGARTRAPGGRDLGRWAGAPTAGAVAVAPPSLGAIAGARSVQPAARPVVGTARAGAARKRRARACRLLSRRRRCPENKHAWTRIRDAATGLLCDRR